MSAWVCRLDLLRGQDITGPWANVANNQRSAAAPRGHQPPRPPAHPVWYMPNVASRQAMRDPFTADHNTFYRDHDVVAVQALVWRGERAKPPVDAAIGKVPRTADHHPAVLRQAHDRRDGSGLDRHLHARELRSPESYFQAAFRVQSPGRRPCRTPPVEVHHPGRVHGTPSRCSNFALSEQARHPRPSDYATRPRAEASASPADPRPQRRVHGVLLPVRSRRLRHEAPLSHADVIDSPDSSGVEALHARPPAGTRHRTITLTRAMEQLADTEPFASLGARSRMFSKHRHRAHSRRSTPPRNPARVEGRESSCWTRRSREGGSHKKTRRPEDQKASSPRIPAFTGT